MLIQGICTAPAPRRVKVRKEVVSSHNSKTKDLGKKEEE